MPYSIRFVKGSSRPYKIVKSDTGEEVGSSSSRAMAEASVRARWSGEGGRGGRGSCGGKRKFDGFGPRQ